MKKITYATGFFALSFLLWQCSPKTTAAPSVVDAFLTKSEAMKSSPTDLAAGKELFDAKCSKCHGVRAPETKEAEQWHKTLNKMIPKTKVTDSEGAQIRAYVVANSK